MRIGPSKKYPGEKAGFLTKKVKAGQAFAYFGGYIYVKGDPKIPKDNSMQTTIPGTTLIIDAKGFDQSMGKGQYLNDGLKEDAMCRIRASPNGRYSLVYALGDFPIHTEMHTCYNGDYWLVLMQWKKLSAENKLLAAALYNISPPE